MNNAGDQLTNEIERGETRSRWAAWIIVVGLVIEVVLALNFQGGKTVVENWGSVAADILVALGVYGEIHFSGNAARAQKSLQAIIDGKLTDALTRAARAEEQLIEFRKPRRALMTPANLERIIKRLSSFAGTEFDCGMGQGGEQADFWWDLQPAIVAAGWTHIAWQYPPGPLPLLIKQGPDRPGSGSVGAVNVEVHLHPDHRKRLLPAATALVSVLNEIGIAARDAGHNAHSTNNVAIHILIGDKQ
jgi:hypothetical protein